MTCKFCASMAINPHLHGRVKGRNLDMCDVCYWRYEADRLKGTLQRVQVHVLHDDFLNLGRLKELLNEALMDGGAK